MENMNSISSNRKLFITANELAGLMGISPSNAYKIIRQLNAELKAEGYLVISGKVPTRYLEKRCYGLEQ